MAYIVFADGDLDQIVETKDIALKEKRDLQSMGFTVRLKKFDSMAEAEEWAEEHDYI